MTQRKVTIVLMVFQLISILIGFVIVLLAPANQTAHVGVGLGIFFPIVAVLLYAAWKGWQWAGLVNCIILTLVCSFFLVNPQDNTTFSPIIFTPVAFSMAMSNAHWTLGLGIFQIAVSTIREQNAPPFQIAGYILSYALVLLCLYLTRLTLEHSQRENEQILSLANTARLEAETTAQSLAEQTHVLEQQSTEQRQLLETVSALETPIVEVAEGVLMAPVVGHFHSDRAERLSQKLLETMALHQAHALILDITGLTLLDTALAQRLLQLARGVRLLGGQIIISGINPDVATTLVEQNITMRGIKTAPTLQVALNDLQTNPIA